MTMPTPSRHRRARRRLTTMTLATVTVALVVSCSNATAGPPQPEPEAYPLHTGIVATTFWVGEIFDPTASDGSQVYSTYDSRWAAHYGGCDGIVKRVVADQGSKKDLLAGLRRVGIDEIAHRKGHRYLTCVVDHDTGRLVWAARGRNTETLLKFFDALGPWHGRPS